MTYQSKNSFQISMQEYNYDAYNHNDAGRQASRKNSHNTQQMHLANTY